MVNKQMKAVEDAFYQAFSTVSLEEIMSIVKGNYEDVRNND